MVTTGTRHLKDITDAELTTLVELSGEWGVKKFWGDIKITEIDRLMFDNTICIDYEQDRIRDGEKATSTMYFNYNELSYHVAHHYPYERMGDCHSVCERTQMFLWLLEQDFNVLEMLTHAPVDPKGRISYFTCGYVVGNRHTDWFDFEHAKYFGVDNKKDAKEYLEKEKAEGRRHRLYHLIDYNLHEEADNLCANEGIEELAKFIRVHLSEIPDNAQKEFESIYTRTTGKMMYGGFKD